MNTLADGDLADELTVLLICLNEEANIGRTLESLKWAKCIVVLDSYSTDNTLEIVKRYPNVSVIQHEFIGFADQCNYGLSQVESEWVLSIDADYVFPEGSGDAIMRALSGRFEAYEAAFEYWVYGKPVHGSILPPRTVLYRTKHGKYVDDGHGHRVVVKGEISRLPFRICHDDRKPLSRWLQSQVVYAQQEAEKLVDEEPAKLCLNDRIRRLILVAPWLVFFLVYFARGGILSGWRGLFYAGQRFVAEILLSLYLIERRWLSVRAPGADDSHRT